MKSRLLAAILVVPILSLMGVAWILQLVAAFLAWPIQETPSKFRDLVDDFTHGFRSA